MPHGTGGGVHQRLKCRDHHQTDAVLQCFPRGGEALHAVIKGAHFSQVFIAEYRAHGLGFLAHFPPRRTAGLNQRVQLPCAVSKQLHGQRIPLCAGLHVVQRINGIPEHVFRAPHVSIKVLDGYAQLHEVLVRCAAGIGKAFRHVLGQVFHAVADTLHRGVNEVAGIAPFLQPLGADACLHGEGCHIVCIGACALRHLKGCRQGRCRCCAHGSHGHCRRLASGHQCPAGNASGALQGFLQLAVLLLCILGFVALILHGIPGLLRCLCQFAAGTGLLFRLGSQIVHAVFGCFAGALHVVQCRLCGADFGAHLVHGGGCPVQGDLQVVGLLGVCAVFLLRFRQLLGNQLHLLLMRCIDGLQALQLAPHGLHAVRLPGEGTLAGRHVRVQHRQLPGDVGQCGLVLFVSQYADFRLYAFVRHTFPSVSIKKKELDCSNSDDHKP